MGRFIQNSKSQTQCQILHWLDKSLEMQTEN